MLRALLAVIACLCLSGCWVSEKGLFGSGDWAHLDLAGTYDVKGSTGDEPSTVTLSVRDDGLVQNIPAEGEEIQPLGFVPIPGGSGRFFLAVDPSNPDGDADIYYMAHLTLDGDLALYMPNCSGTSARDGLVIEEESKGGQSCIFTSKEALLDAALEAERFLSARHIIAVVPIYSLERNEDVEELEEAE